MNRYDEQLCKLQAQCARKKKLETCIAELCTQRNTYSARARELKESFLKEQADVDRLEGRSLSAFFYNVIGKMDEKLTQKRQEAYAAQVKYDAVARELAGIEEDLERYQAELHSLQNCEARYFAVLREKTQAVKANGGDIAQQILRLEERTAYLESQSRELEEAFAAGQGALTTTDQIMDSLDSAESWGTWDLVGGGLVGAETADTLSQSCQVSVIEMQPRIMGDGEYSTAYYMKQRFQQFGVQVCTSTKVLEIGSHTVAAEREGQAITLEDVDFVVIAVGVKTDTALFDQLEGLPWPVCKVGDANGVKNGYLGIREGFEAGLAL